MITQWLTQTAAKLNEFAPFILFAALAVIAYLYDRRATWRRGWDARGREMADRVINEVRRNTSQRL